jgi:exosortase H (IPTLxxWG-CTERM-specific)
MTTRSNGSEAREAEAGAVTTRRDLVRFFVFFLLLAAVLVPGIQLLERADWFAAAVRGLCTAHTWIAHAVLQTLGFDVSRWGTRISGDGFTVVVTSACSGLLGSVLLLSAVVAFPARWRARAWGLLIGVGALFLLNQLRIVSLFYVGSRFPELFEEVHYYVWPLLIILGVAAYFYFWVHAILGARQDSA